MRQLQLSEKAIKTYFYCLGSLPLTHDELCKIIPNLSQEENEAVLLELIENGLLKKITPEHPKSIFYYKAQPPITQILNYYDNIYKNLNDIKGAIQSLLQKSLQKVFANTSEIELDTVYAELKEIMKDISEDTLLQKQEVKEILKEMEALNVIAETLENFKQKINKLTQTQVFDITNKLLGVKNSIIEKIKPLELKKKEPLVFEIIENNFGERVKSIILELGATLQQLIEEEYQAINNSISDLIEKSFKHLIEMKTLLMGMVNNFDVRMKEIFNAVENNKNNLDEGIKKIKTNIIKNINSIIQGSIDQVSGLNKPMEDVLKQYFIQVSKTNEIFIDKLWVIKSRVKLEEEMKNIIKHAQERLTIVIPKIEEFFTIEEIESFPATLVINLSSSDPPTNSRVKKLNQQSNFSFKHLQNENLLIIRGDDNYFILAILFEDSENPLNDIIGLGCNYIPLINIFNKIIEKMWSGGALDSLTSLPKPQYVPKIKDTPPLTPPTPPIQEIKPMKPISEELKTQLADNKEENDTISTQINSKTFLEPPISKIEPAASIGTSQFISTVVPDPDDTSGILINNAFNFLIQSFNILKGNEFSEQLDKIAESILEKKGFSVTLHNIRSVINNYKEYPDYLNDLDKQQIFEAIENWKQHLFSKK